MARRPLLGEEDAEHDLLEVGGPVQSLDAVVGEDAGELGAELLRQSLPVDVEGVQVGVEVLARGVHPVVRALLGVRTVAGELAEVGEDRQHGQLGPEQLLPLPVENVADLLVLHGGAAAVVGADVVAQDHALEVGEQAQGAHAVVEHDGAAGQVHRSVGRRRGLRVLADGLQAQQRLSPRRPGRWRRRGAP